MPLQNCRVVLVRPMYAGNIGATARVMRNMGLTQLTLVAPQADPTDKQARQMSTHGEPILHSAHIVAGLGDALADCVLAVATSARTAGLFRHQTVAMPEEVMPRLLDAAADAPVALVFGPEQTGLSNAEVTRCHHLIHVPTDPSYGALNLAQAVAICLYELRRSWLRRTGGEPVRERTPTAMAHQERMFDLLKTALTEIHFLWDEKADALFHAVRHVIGRAGPTAQEADILIGLARQIRWHARHGGRAADQPPP
jgi:tRNA/rRNA methyltransferase